LLLLLLLLVLLLSPIVFLCDPQLNLATQVRVQHFHPRHVALEAFWSRCLGVHDTPYLLLFFVGGFLLMVITEVFRAFVYISFFISLAFYLASGFHSPNRWQVCKI